MLWGVLSCLTPSLFEDFALDEGSHDEDAGYKGNYGG